MLIRHKGVPSRALRRQFVFQKVLPEFPIWNMMLAVSHLWLHTAPMSGEDTTGGLPSTLPPGRDVEADVPGVDAPGSGLI